MYCSQNTLAGGCGIGNVYEFRKSSYYSPQNTTNVVVGGTGLFMASFINTKICKEAYEELCSKYRLVMQTPKRRNSNSWNGFIACMFDRVTTDKAKKEMPTIEATWPWKRTTREDN